MKNFCYRAPTHIIQNLTIQHIWGRALMNCNETKKRMHFTIATEVLRCRKRPKCRSQSEGFRLWKSTQAGKNLRKPSFDAHIGTGMKTWCRSLDLNWLQMQLNEAKKCMHILLFKDQWGLSKWARAWANPPSRDCVNGISLCMYVCMYVFTMVIPIMF